MIEELLPAEVATTEARGDCMGAGLFPEEERFVRTAADGRWREFAAGRTCTRMALVKIGLRAMAISMGTRGKPRWPAGVVGSITHCAGYRGCAVARSGQILTLGIDAEPNASLLKGLVNDIARLEESPALRILQLEVPEVHWDRLLFCANEATYKAWFPLARGWLGFEDASVEFDRGGNRFTTRLMTKELTPGLSRVISGRWLVRDGIILTAIALSAQRGASDELVYVCDAA